MAINAAHWSVERDTGVISYIGGDHDSSPSYATVIEFHRWLQGLADDAVAAGDDELDITNTDPSRRSTDNIITLINGYTISAVEAEHLYDGSIIQNGGDDIWDGIVNFGNADVQIQLIQNGAVLADDWWNFGGAGLNADSQAGISHRFMIKTRTGGADIDGRRIIGTCRRFNYTYSEFTINGSARGNNVLALSDGLDLNNEGTLATVSGYSTITNTNEGYTGIDVNNDTTNEYYYSEWDRATYTINEFYERMKYLTRDGSTSTLYGINGELFRGITHQVALSAGNGTWTEPEAVGWANGTGQLLAVNNTDAPTSTAMWIQILTGTVPSTTTISGISSGAYATTGTVTERSINRPFVGQSTGSAIIGAYGVGIQVSDLTSADKVKDLTDTVITPPNYVTNTVAGVVHSEDYVLVAPWDGSSYDTNGDPAINKSQLALAGNLTTSGIASVTVSGTIPSDTPSAGYIRVADDDGFEHRIKYSSWATDTFTVDGSYHDGTLDRQDEFDGATGTGRYQATIGNNVYIAYIDELVTGSVVTTGNFVTGVTYIIKVVGDTDFTLIGAASNTIGVTFTATGSGGGTTGTAYTQSATGTFTSVQSGSRSLVVVVRDGGSSPIKQFISAWSQTSSAQTITAIRTTDT